MHIPSYHLGFSCNIVKEMYVYGNIDSTPTYKSNKMVMMRIYNDIIILHRMNAMPLSEHIAYRISRRIERNI